MNEGMGPVREEVPRGVFLATCVSNHVRNALAAREHLGGLVRKLREARGQTLAFTAEHLGIAEGVLSRIETGKLDPTVKALEAIWRWANAAYKAAKMEAVREREGVLYD